ncbi:MAG: hypothetical protein K1X36_04420 [Pyrinomonadaceae bacterium]|nr:hypothetical protein [Pyrinomonadaceae bacterium]
MRKTITISVSEEMYSLIQQGTRTHFCSSVSEYIRYLVRRDQRHDLVKEEVQPVRRPLRTANQAMENALRRMD